MEQSWYRREMRRRPLMINTAPGEASPARRARRNPRAPHPPHPPRRHTTVRHTRADIALHHYVVALILEAHKFPGVFSVFEERPWKGC